MNQVGGKGGAPDKIPAPMPKMPKKKGEKKPQKKTK